MTTINASALSGLTGADSALIARAVALINDQRLTSLETLRQELNKGTWIIRPGTPADKLGDSPAVYFDPERDDKGRIVKPGQIVLRPVDISYNSEANVLKLVDNLRHEAEHGQLSKEEHRRNAGIALVDAKSSLSTTERGDNYVKAMLDEETQARYEGWRFRDQLNGLDTGYAGPNRAYFGADDLYKEFARLEGLANEFGLKGADRQTYIIEEARDAMAAFGTRTYPKRFAEEVTKVFQIKDTPAGADYLEHVRKSFNVVGFEVTDVVMHDDGSSSGSVVYEDGRRLDQVFDPRGKLFQKIETAANGDEVTTQYFENGKVSRVVETDGANDDADYAKRTTNYDAEGRVDNVTTVMDDGSREWVDHDQANQTAQRIWSNRIDAQELEDWRRITGDDGGVEWIDYDQNNLTTHRIWSSHTDAQGRVDWIKITGDDGGVEWIDHDQANQTNQRTWSNYTDAQGREDWIKITGDDGGVEWIDIDQLGQTAQRIWSNRTDAQGREDWIKITGDDGGVEWIDIDQLGQTEQRIWSNYTDAQGREDWRKITGDDGGVEWIDFDQLGQTSQQIWSNRTDAQGREDWRKITGDDGGIEWIDYDQADQTGQRIWSNYTDAQGREDWCRITGDDGGIEWIDYDQANVTGHRIWSNRTDAQGREDWRRITGDDGGVELIDYDQANERGDRIWTNYTDAQGRLDWTNIDRDNGSRVLYDYDQDGSKSWSRAETYFDTTGRPDFKDVYLDNGGYQRWEYFADMWIHMVPNP